MKHSKKKRNVRKIQTLVLPRNCPALADDPDPNFKHCWFQSGICIHCHFNACKV